MSLSEQARTGLREMPSNAAWLLSRVLRSRQTRSEPPLNPPPRTRAIRAGR